MDAQTTTYAAIGSALLVALWLRRRNATVTAPLGRTETHILTNRPITTTGFDNPAYGEPLYTEGTPPPPLPPTGAGGTTPNTPRTYTKGPTTVDITTYNVLKSTTSLQTIHALEKLITGGSDVITLGEWNTKHNDAADWLRKHGFGFFRGKGETPVAWDNKKYEEIDSGSVLANPKTRGTLVEGHHGVGENRRKVWTEYVNWVRLRDRKTGKTFTVVSAHTMPSVRQASADERRGVMREELRTVAALTKRLASKGPVFVGGDFNTAPGDGTAWRQAKAVMGGANLRSNWDWLGTRNMGKGTLGRRFVDMVWSLVGRGPKLRVINERVIRGLPSDHDAVNVRYRIA